MSSKLFDKTEYTARVNLLAEKYDYRQLVYAAERLYGTGGFGNSLALCLAIEGAGETIVPAKAQYIRTILMELSMMQENFLRLAAIAEYLRYDRLSMLCWTEREKVLEILDDLTGNRMFLSMCVPGGVRRELDSAILAEAMEEMKVIVQKSQKITELFSNDAGIKRSLKGLGIVSKEAALGSGVTGPAAKASGAEADRRMLGEYGAYRELGFKPVTETAGDCHARCMVKAREVIQSGDLVMAAAASIPEGRFKTDVPDRIFGKWIARIEQVDGMETYYIKGRDSAFLEEVGIKKAGESNEKVMFRVENCPMERETLIRLTLGLDDCLAER